MFFEILIFAQNLIKFGQNPSNNVKEITCTPQLEMFKTVRASFINPQPELCLLTKEIG
jgi:hypothetical protein